MQLMYEVACGLDVHKETVVACVSEVRGKRQERKELRTFAAHTRGLREMREWLKSQKVEAISMEGTGIYWRPVYAVLEGADVTWKLVVGNAHHVAKVPGRKTDAKDAEWLSELVQFGLISPSFVPPPEVRLLRDLTRYRKKLVQDRTRQQERVLKVLQAANIKLDGVASDAFGVSGMLMLRALAAGEATPKEMAALAKGNLKKKIDALEVALEGTLGIVHRGMLAAALRLLDGFQAALAEIDSLIDKQVSPWAEAIERLTSIPGFDRVMAVSVLAEVGPDMAVFPTEHHLASWTGVSPGNNESAGKSRDGRSQRGNPYLKTMLCQAAQSAWRTKGSYVRDKFFRLKARRGHNKAVMALAHKLAISVFHILKSGGTYKELGDGWLDARDRKRVARGLIDRLHSLGYEVTLRDCSTPAARA
jgi:transposase